MLIINSYYFILGYDQDKYKYLDKQYGNIE